jgi:hypothetical protein
MDRTLPESTAKEEAASKLNYLIVVLVLQLYSSSSRHMLKMAKAEASHCGEPRKHGVSR